MIEKYSNLIYAAAQQHGLDPLLVAAIVKKESDFDTWAVRFEKKWRWFLSPKTWAKVVRVSEATETICQQMSWGLMQVMGTVSRERGMDQDIPQLCKAQIGLHYGCKHLALLLKTHGDRDAAISSYNQGSPRRKLNGDFKNQEYVDEVLAHYAAFGGVNT